MDSWFIRHWPSDREWSSWSDDENRTIQQQLFDKREIGIHYQKTCSLDSSAYPKKQQKYIHMFIKLVNEGGYVCAHYPAIRRTLIGKLNPADVDAIQCSANFFYIKRVRLVQAEEVSGWRKIILLVAAPRKGTMGRWHSIGKLLHVMVEHAEIVPEWQLLPPSVQEAVCQEYMRERHGMERLLLPFGRTMADVDIVGIGVGGQKIFAQVKYNGTRQQYTDAATKLLDYPGERLFFCSRPSYADQLEGAFHDLITFVWTQDVWKWLRSERAYTNELFTFL